MATMSYFEKIETFVAKVQEQCVNQGFAFEDFFNTFCRMENQAPPDKSRMQHELYDLFLSTADIIHKCNIEVKERLQIIDLLLKIYNALSDTEESPELVKSEKKKLNKNI